MGERVKIWYDKDGSIVGFSVLNVSSLSQTKPLSVDLVKRAG